MKIFTKNILYIGLAMVVLFTTSCATSKSYADRKKKKYNRSTSVVKTSKKKSTRTYHPKKQQSLRSQIVATAKKQIGKKYVYGGKTTNGFDCSGFTAYVFNKNGIDVSGPSHHQARQGVSVTKSRLDVGDLIFFGKGKVSHVGIVASVDNNELKIIHSTSSRGVILEDISNSKYWQSRYLYGRDVLSSSYVSR